MLLARNTVSVVCSHQWWQLQRVSRIPVFPHICLILGLDWSNTHIGNLMDTLATYRVWKWVSMQVAPAASNECFRIISNEITVVSLLLCLWSCHQHRECQVDGTWDGAFLRSRTVNTVHGWDLLQSGISWVEFFFKKIFIAFAYLAIQFLDFWVIIS